MGTALRQPLVSPSSAVMGVLLLSSSPNLLYLRFHVALLRCQISRVTTLISRSETRNIRLL